MTERGILFSAPMVRALLDGSKTQTRRAIKPHPSDDAFVLLDHGDGWWPYRSADGESANVDNMEYPFNCPYGQPGDRLWVRETFMDLNGTGVEHCDSAGLRQRYAFAADTPLGSYGDEARKDFGLKWEPSIHMPREASRILLEITGLRVERLQHMSEADARAEGVTIEEQHKVGYCAGEYLPPSLRAFRELWKSINGAGSWDANPWVWVVEFKRVTP